MSPSLPVIDIHGSAVDCTKLMDSMYCLKTVFQHLKDCFRMYSVYKLNLAPL